MSEIDRDSVIPIVSWLRGQAGESLLHAQQAGELLALVADRSVALEEYSREMIQAEELHAAEVERMLRKPSG